MLTVLICMGPTLLYQSAAVCHVVCFTDVPCQDQQADSMHCVVVVHQAYSACMPKVQTQDDEKEASGDESASQGRNTRQDKGGSKQNNGEEGEEGKEGSKDPGYNFSMTETTILEVVMDSMRTCGLALALQALSTIMLGRVRCTTF